jgi:hypothetical protein
VGLDGASREDLTENAGVRRLSETVGVQHTLEHFIQNQLDTFPANTVLPKTQQLLEYGKLSNTHFPPL